jgi:hypothetical protein
LGLLSPRASLGARAYYDQLRTRGTGRAALRPFGNRLVGILHGCPKTATNYDEYTAGPQNCRSAETSWDV